MDAVVGAGTEPAFDECFRHHDSLLSKRHGDNYGRRGEVNEGEMDQG